jgi:hypothetical protein
MHAGVGSACTRNGDALTEHLGERILHDAGNGSHRRLALKATELRAVVFDGGTQPERRFD